ncbi:preprotein translocase subunit YajC [Streptomyces sp. NPDC059506]|uniref:preprotein translocase subunit YajC n=1 Tax=unclassified Streptomyces TaxID=2593676 RepID=UPI0022AB3E80|nr:preprotein translocase subunit YajC [Streptomyces sp. HB2AG]MCZ2527049.1 preprotein translocase subunit YajC [Streptomyces sp. HB2AG]
MDIVTLLPFALLIGVMFLMTRSARNKQRQAMQMRDQMQPGTGVRTIGGMYALVEEVNDDTVVLEIAPGVHAVYAKNAIGAVLDEDEYRRIVHGEPAVTKDGDLPPVLPDADGRAGEDRVGLTKGEPADRPADKVADEDGTTENGPGDGPAAK